MNTCENVKKVDYKYNYPNTNAEEKVFTIPEMRRNILSFIIEPLSEDIESEPKPVQNKPSTWDKIKLNCICLCCTPCIIYKIHEAGLIRCFFCC